MLKLNIMNSMNGDAKMSTIWYHTLQLSLRFKDLQASSPFISTNFPSGIHVVGRSVALYSTTGNKDMVACFPIVAQAQSTYYRFALNFRISIPTFVLPFKAYN